MPDCIYLACSAVAANIKNDHSVLPDCKSSRNSADSVPVVGNFRRLSESEHLPVKLKQALTAPFSQSGCMAALFREILLFICKNIRMYSISLLQILL